MKKSKLLLQPPTSPSGGLKDEKEKMHPLTKDELHASMYKAKWDFVKLFAGMLTVQTVVIVVIISILLKMKI